MKDNKVIHFFLRIVSIDPRTFSLNVLYIFIFLIVIAALVISFSNLFSDKVAQNPTSNNIPSSDAENMSNWYTGSNTSAINTDESTIYNQFNYVETGELVEENEIGNVLGEIKRIGEWDIKRDYDSNTYPPGSILYEIKNIPDRAYIAVGIRNGKEGKGKIIRYEKLKQSSSVKQPDKKK